jgi:hypothetical protein
MTTPRKTSPGKIKRAYFRWLCDSVKIDPQHPDHDCTELMIMLHKIPFYDLVPNDENRGRDGTLLRDQFAIERMDEDCYCDQCKCLDMPCSVLEMLVALADRIEYQMSEPGTRSRKPDWFWMMVKNLGLQLYTREDPYYIEKGQQNENIIKNFLERLYMRNGEGGLFPLKRALRDQRHIEIWYQMMAYIQENFPN